ncbi:MAG: hypothetical protein ABJB98_08195 [Actinomycetota bacterium]
MRDGSGPVIGIVGGSGGVGASTFAAVLAAAGDGVLVDLDPVAGGVDVLLGAEDVPGPRWSGLRLGGGGLSPQALAQGLPRWGSASFVAADVTPSADPVRQLLDVACHLGPVAVDLGRAAHPARSAALDRCDLVLVVARADVTGVTAARAAVRELACSACGLVVRSSRGLASPNRVADLVGWPLIGTLPSVNRAGESPLATGTPPRAMQLLARGVLDAIVQDAA